MNPGIIFILAIFFGIIVYIILGGLHQLAYKILTKNIPLDQKSKNLENQEQQYKQEQEKRTKLLIGAGIISLILGFFPAIAIGFTPIAHSAPPVGIIPFAIIIFGFLIFITLFLAYFVYRTINFVGMVSFSILFPRRVVLEKKYMERIAIGITVLIFIGIITLYLLKQYSDNLLHSCPSCSTRNPFLFQ